MSRYCLCVPDYLPLRLNRLLGCHWGKRTRLKASDRETVGWYARTSGIPAASGKRRVSLLFVLARGQRRGDPDGYLKVMLDCLVSAGLLRDDSARYCEIGAIEFARGDKRRTIILLEEVSG